LDRLKISKEIPHKFVPKKVERYHGVSAFNDFHMILYYGMIVGMVALGFFITAFTWDIISKKIKKIK